MRYKIIKISLLGFFTILFVVGFIFTLNAEGKVEADYVLLASYAQWDYGQPFSPDGIAVDPFTQEIYITEAKSNTIQKFMLSPTCPEGTTQVKPNLCFVTKWGGQGTSSGKFDNPNGDIAVDPSTHELYVADSGNNRVQKFLLADKCSMGMIQITSGVCYVTKWSINKPRDVAIDPSTHEVYVAGIDRIQKLSSKGELITQWYLQPGAGNGYFGKSGPNGMVVGPKGLAIDPTTHEVYVGDPWNFRIQKFVFAPSCPRGAIQIKAGVCFVTKWGTLGDSNGQFSNEIYGIAVSHSGYVYVSDQDRPTQVFRLSNSCPVGAEITQGVCFIRKFGGENGQNIEVDSDDRIYLTGSVSFSVLKWKSMIPPSISVPK